eukprot:m.97486 g.97486  ORF g.97486 m.97486 type:complete len:562 (+) comp10218_c0_seq2:436-2121(+)
MATRTPAPAAAAVRTAERGDDTARSRGSAASETLDGFDDVWDDDDSDDDEFGASSDDDDEPPPIVWRDKPRENIMLAKESTKRIGGVFRAKTSQAADAGDDSMDTRETDVVSPTVPEQLSYSNVYSDDSADEGWGFSDDEAAATEEVKLRVPGRPGSDFRMSGIDLAFVERHFDYPPMDNAGNTTRDTTTATTTTPPRTSLTHGLPVPTAAESVLLLALDGDVQASLVASLYRNDEEAARETAIELEEDVAEARRRTEEEAMYGTSTLAYFTHTNSRLHPTRRGPSFDTDAAGADGSGAGRLATVRDPSSTRRKKPMLVQHFTDAVLEAGWLDKRGGGTRRLGNTRYKRRWFELVRTAKGIYLTYQVEPGDGALKGAIKMSKARLQSDTTTRFSVHIDSTTGPARSYHIKASTMEEKYAWLRAANGLMPLPRQNPDLFKHRTLPLLSGWLKTHVVGGRKPLKAKERWIQVWDKGENRGPFLAILDGPAETRSQLELPLRDAMVVNEAGNTDGFVVMALGSEVRLSSSVVSKTKWLEPLAAKTEGGIVLEKNTGRRASIISD